MALTQRPRDQWGLNLEHLGRSSHSMWVYNKVYHSFLGRSASNNSFTCGEGKFKCPSEMCIPDLWRCDGANDCGDNSDELNCTPSTCRPDYEFQCKSGKCIPKRWRCDGASECPDISDETDCGQYLRIYPHPRAKLKPLGPKFLLVTF